MRQDPVYYIYYIALRPDGVWRLVSYLYYTKYALLGNNTVEEWDVWPQGPRLQGEDGGKARARGSDKTTEQSNNRTSIKHRNIIDIYQNRI
jgi:hypothetical protein